MITMEMIVLLLENYAGRTVKSVMPVILTIDLRVNILKRLLFLECVHVLMEPMQRQQYQHLIVQTALLNAVSVPRQPTLIA